MNAPRLDPHDLQALGGAFAAGYDAERARRTFEPGRSFDPTMDLELALGWPFLLRLEPPGGAADPLEAVRARLAGNMADRVWPADLVRPALRLVAAEPADDDAPTMTLAALSEPIDAADAKAMLSQVFTREPWAWRHPLWIVSALESVVGGAAVVHGLLDLIERSTGEPWQRVHAMGWSLVRRAAYMVNRLTPTQAAPLRERARALLTRALAATAGLVSNDALRLMPTRALAMLTDDPELVREAGTYRGELDMSAAVFLSRDELLATLRSRGRPEPGEEASAEWVVIGGPEVLDIELRRWRDYGAQRQRAEAHARVLEQYGVFQHESAVALVADMAAASVVKTQASAWLRTHRGFAEPTLLRLAKSNSPLAAPADKALKQLSKSKPS